jgi:hypothetical protein
VKKQKYKSVILKEKNYSRITSGVVDICRYSGSEEHRRGVGKSSKEEQMFELCFEGQGRIHQAEEGEGIPGRDKTRAEAQKYSLGSIGDWLRNPIWLEHWV